MSSCNKTPVAILHEYCVRKNMVEQFNLINATGSANDPMFEMCVETSSGLRAFGSGKTKKEAKHNAATELLRTLDVPAITSGQPEQLAPPIVNPHRDRGSTGNAVGRLQEYCALHSLPNPIYELTGDEGEPHEKTFLMKCEVSQRYETGVGRTKQLAKHNAAQAMYETLQQNPSLAVDPVPTESAHSRKLSEDQIERVIASYAICRPASSLPASSPGLKFSQYHESMENTLTAVKQDLYTLLFSSPVETLKSLVEKLSLEVNYHPGEPEKENGKCYVYAVVDTKPMTVQVGEGDSTYEATMQAALSVLKYWQKFVGIYSTS